MNRQKILLAHPGITLIDTTVSTTITDEMFRCCNNTRALHGLNHTTCKFLDQNRIRTVGLIGPSPPGVERDRQCGSEDPVDTCGTHLLGSRFSDRSGQLRITNRAQRDVVRKNRGANDIVVAMDGIGTPYDRDARVALRRIDGGLVVAVRKIQPTLHRGILVLVGKRTTAVQHATQTIFADIIRCDVLNLALNHLGDFLLKGQRGDQCLNTSIHTVLRMGISQGPKSQNHGNRCASSPQISRS